MVWLNLSEEIAEEFESFSERLTYREQSEGFHIPFGTYFGFGEEGILAREAKRKEAYQSWIASPRFSRHNFHLTRPKSEPIVESEASRAWRRAYERKRSATRTA